MTMAEKTVVTEGIVTAWWNTCQYSYFREDMDDDF
jgi:hypothetical protein